MDTGAILCDRYRIEKMLGRGGMAEVYLAFDLRRQAHVALKLLREDLAEDPEFTHRFEREAKALALLDHPYVVRFYGFERQGALAFIVMDYVPGSTLRRRLLNAGGPLPLDETTGILRQIAGALQYAHDEGYIHRDVKPGNIMLRQDGTALLSDFGIARAIEGTTLTTGPAGTPAYMSPEQIAGRELDARADIYSLGLVLFEMVTGRRPFVGDTGIGTTPTERIRDEHMHLPPPDPRHFNRELPGGVVEVIMRCLAKWSGDRWPDMVSLVSAWEEAVAQAGKPATPAIAAVTRPGISSPPSSDRLAAPPSVRHAIPVRQPSGATLPVSLMAAGGVVLALTLVVIGILVGSSLTSRGRSEPAAVTTRPTITSLAIIPPTTTLRPTLVQPTAIPTSTSTPVPPATPSIAATAPPVNRSVLPTVTPAPLTSTPVLPTVPPGPTATSAIGSYPAPTLLNPPPGANVSGRVTFVWNWSGQALASNQGFEVRIWKEGQPDHYGAAEPVQTTNATIDVRGAYGVAQGGAGAYLWTVALVRRDPYQRIGPEAIPRPLIVQFEGSGPPPTWTPPPP